MLCGNFRRTAIRADRSFRPAHGPMQLRSGVALAGMGTVVRSAPASRSSNPGRETSAIRVAARISDRWHTHNYTGGNALALRAILDREPTGYRAFAARFAAEMG